MSSERLHRDGLHRVARRTVSAKCKPSPRRSSEAEVEPGAPRKPVPSRARGRGGDFAEPEPASAETTNAAESA
jgi:hypothetical protein